MMHIMDPTRGKNSNCEFDEARFLDVFGHLAKKAKDVAPDQVAPADSSLDEPTEPEPNMQSDDDCTTEEAQTQDDDDSWEDVDWDKEVDNEMAEVDQDDEFNVELGDELEDYNPSANPGDVKYASYLARRLIQTAHNCDICTDTFSVSKEDRGTQHSILDLTVNKKAEYSYIACTGSIQEVVHRATVAFVAEVRKSFHEKTLGELLAKAITSVRGFNELFSHCPLHDDANRAFFVKVFTSSLIRLLLRHQNQGLKAYMKASRRKTKVAGLAGSSKTCPSLFDEKWLNLKSSQIEEDKAGYVYT
jgi:hypothetical protein